MPRAIILYEIDKSFGPNILAEYYLKEGDKIPTSTLKEFSEKHVKRDLDELTIRKDDIRYYSSKVNAEAIEKDNIYMSFILEDGEDLVSLKSFFTNVEANVIQNFTTDKKKMNEFLKKTMNSILSLIEKLKEPKIIKDAINERTKQMLDDGKLTEARELIDLGEEIPEKLAAEVNIAEQWLAEGDYKRAKKCFLKAAELALIIQENEISSFLVNKGNHVGTFPEVIKERDNLYKELEKRTVEIERNELYVYNYLLDPIERLIEISNNFEVIESIDTLLKLKSDTERAIRLAKELYSLDKKIRELLNNI